MIRTHSQNSQLHFFLGKLNISGELKEELVHQYTNGRSNRSSGMTPEECQRLINYLKSELRKKERAATAPAQKVSTPESRMRGKILSMCHEMGWEKEGGKIDMLRVNAFCEERGKYKKKLDAHDTKELVQLVTQFEQVLQDFYHAKR